MIRLMKKNIVNITVISTIILIFIQRSIINDNFSRITNDIMKNMPKGNIHIFYSYFFSIVGQPLAQGMLLSLLFILYIYLISLILYLLSLIIRVKIGFSKVVEIFTLSYIVIITRRVIEIIGLLLKINCDGLILNFIFSVIHMIVYCRLIRRYSNGEKVNNIIYYGLIMLSTILFNTILIVISRL